MSWHFSRVLVEEYLVANYLDGEQSAPLNGTDTHGTFWSPDKMTDALKPSRSGMTFRPLTESHGEELLTWFLEAFHAKTSLPLAKEPELKESEAVCGNTWRESSVKFDRNTHLWKTHRCLWEEDFLSSSLTLPKWGMMRSGVLWERITSPLHTDETESGCWVGTPTATMSVRSEEFAKGRLPQPAEFVKQWPTPRAGNPGSRPNGKGGKILAEEVKKSLWPTQNQRDWKDTGATQGNRKSPNLGTMVHQQATPCAGDYRSPNLNPCKNGQKIEPLSGHALPAQVGGQLNPTWVEWLMGWPLGWTDCAASATDKFRLWQHSHGVS